MEKIQTITMDGCCKIGVKSLIYDDFLHVQMGCLVFENEAVDFIAKDEPKRIVDALNMSEEKLVSLLISRCRENTLKDHLNYWDIVFTFSKKENTRQITVIMKENDVAKFLAYFSRNSLKNM